MKDIKSFFKLSVDNKILTFILLCFGLVALAPITNADSLNYHLGVPLSILKNNQFIWHKEWFQFGLSGISENINLISLALNAEQIPNLLQFFSLLSIIGLFCQRNTQISQKERLSTPIILLILSTPVLFFLASSPKPQLNGIALTSLIFWMTINDRINFQNINFKNILFIFLMLFSASATKHNFYLSAFFLFILIAIKIFISKLNLIKTLFSLKFIGGILSAVIIVFTPIIYYKIHFFSNLSLLDYILPLPSNMPGSQNFLSHLANYTDSTFPFPLSIIFPSSFGNISMVLGVNTIILAFLLLSNSFTDKYILVFIFAFIAGSFLIGQRTARFFLEPYIWLYLFIYYKIKDKEFKKIKILRITNQLLSTFTISILLYAIFNLTIGIFSIELREKVLEKNANGYTLSKWVNSKLPTGSKVLLEHRSLSLFNQNIYSADWADFVNFDKSEEELYISYLKNIKIDYIVIVNDNNPQDSKLYKYCDKLAFGPYSFKVATRNPFNAGHLCHSWIYTTKLQ
jgi:hypothetical protein